MTLKHIANNTILLSLKAVYTAWFICQLHVLEMATQLSYHITLRVHNFTLAVCTVLKHMQGQIWGGSGFRTPPLPPPCPPLPPKCTSVCFLFCFCFVPAFFPFIVCLLFLTTIMNNGNQGGGGRAQRTDLIFKVNYCDELLFEVFCIRGK